MSRSRNRIPQSNVALKNQQFMRYQVYKRKWFSYIEKICLTRMKWNNLPETVDERFLERVLMRHGKAVFYKADDDLYLATKVFTQDTPDLYDNYHKFTSIGSNWQQQLPEGDGVLIWDSMTRKPYLDILNVFSEDLAELDQLIHLNNKQQRWGVILTGNETNLKDQHRIIQDLDSGQPVIIGLKEIAEYVEVKKIDLSVPYLAKDFHENQALRLSELYLQLGIINIPKDKEQYMNYSETSMTNDAISRVREDLLLPRQQACDAINKMYGLDISVEWRNDQFDNLIVDPTNDSTSIDETDENFSKNEEVK